MKDKEKFNLIIEKLDKIILLLKSLTLNNSTNPIINPFIIPLDQIKEVVDEPTYNKCTCHLKGKTSALICPVHN